MNNKKQSKGNRTMRERLEAMGMKMTPKDHPIYKTGASIRFISMRVFKKEGKNDE